MAVSALVLLADNFEEIEAVVPIDLLRRAEVSVTVASCTQRLLVQGRSRISVQADCMLQEVEEQNFDLIVLPGGPGVFKVRKNRAIQKIIQKFKNEKKWIGAICAAPLLLLDAEVLGNAKHTAHSSVANELPHIITGKDVVCDGTIITSPGAGTAITFGLALIEALAGSDQAKLIADSIHTTHSKLGIN
ncbi:MAG: DJ-1/PfpI family protein [Opitutales bacterium]|nr:DJ-1/PfpI family protein [Opitutales bacterium]